MADSNFSILIEHYRMNVENLKSSTNKRDLMFLFLILSVMLLVIQSVNIGFINSAIVNLGKIDKNSLPGSSLILTTLWLASFVIFVRYSQCCLFIEMQYKYISIVEKEINKDFEGTDIFLFESEFYKSNSSLYRKLISKFYKKAFPLILIMIFILKIVYDWGGFFQNDLYFYSSILVSLVYILYLTIYFLRK